ncbi:nuclear receptor coactivator 7-like isoform X6 [Ostrea edulis]|uniref:nuclear receptor coactivator 7-like isoform X6 n=1 Tax=Ostrea edulis TaxID=37623 RepID=UPI0024AEB1FA|nr:nuclear receptor coactivator 7-like isoform X6 [Ostrea edulis]
MTTKRPSLKDRMIEKLHTGTARFRGGSNEDLTTGAESESKRSSGTTTWYTHPQPEVTSGEGQIEVTEVSGAVKNGNKPKKVPPEGTVEYKVCGSDTLASIAAHFDTTPTELQKLNRMSTRNVFAGQTLYVPASLMKLKTEESLENSQSHVCSPMKDVPRMDVPLIKMADKPPSRVPGHVERIPTPISSPTEEKTEFHVPHKLSEEEARELDQECYERFIKVHAKHITDGQAYLTANSDDKKGVVSGVLLVTPNAVMFDPNVSDPLVLEHGAERYGVIAPMDMVVSAAMYHDIAAMKVKGQRDGSKKPEVYHDRSCPLFKSWCEGHPSFEVARAASYAGNNEAELVPTDITCTTSVITPSPQSDTASSCSCSTSQGGVSATNSPVKELIPRPAVAAEDPPLYLCLHLGKPVNKLVSETAPIQAYNKKKKKPEYWFSIPREKVDQLYAFFVQWKPELYGDEEEISAERRGFVVLDGEEREDPEEMEVFEEYFNSGITALQKDWEIISAEEACRRKSVEFEETQMLPELHGQSTIIQDYHLEMLNQHMPPRTIGYPWTLVYSTEQHGFSLKTLYRDMHGVDSPVMLLVKDTDDFIFGALTSCELKPSDHFYGTGESFLFTFYPEFKVFRWTGDNNFFIKGNQESLSIGAGQGLFGLWFDEGLYHGQTHRCDTYDNDILTSSEDFIVKVLEAWIFTQD